MTGRLGGGRYNTRNLGDFGGVLGHGTTIEWVVCGRVVVG